MISIGLTIVVAAHLATVYLAMMGPMVCSCLQWWAKGDNLAARLDRYLLRLATLALLVAAALGGLALLLICRLVPDAYLAASRVLSASRYWYGGVELVFSLVCFLLAMALAGRTVASPPRFAARWLATLLGGANLVYHFPTLFVMLGVLCARPHAWGHRIKFTTLLTDPEIAARVTHHLLAALVVTGMAAVWYGARRGGDAARAIAWGARIALAALVLQFVSGLWLVTVLPADSRVMLLGEDTFAAALFGLSLLATFFVLPRLGAMALGHLESRHAIVTAALVLAILLLMTATRHRTRELVLVRQSHLASNVDRSQPRDTCPCRAPPVCCSMPGRMAWTLGYLLPTTSSLSLRVGVARTDLSVVHTNCLTCLTVSSLLKMPPPSRRTASNVAFGPMWTALWSSTPGGATSNCRSTS